MLLRVKPLILFFADLARVLESRAIYAIAISTYTAQSEMHITFRKDDIIRNVRFISREFWKGSVSGKAGLFVRKRFPPPPFLLPRWLLALIPDPLDLFNSPEIWSRSMTRTLRFRHPQSRPQSLERGSARPLSRLPRPQHQPWRFQSEEMCLVHRSVRRPWIHPREHRVHPHRRGQRRAEISWKHSGSR